MLDLTGRGGGGRLISIANRPSCSRRLPPPSSIILFKLQSRSFKRLALDGNRIFPLQVTSRPVSGLEGLNQQKKIIRFVQIKSVMLRKWGGRGSNPALLHYAALKASLKNVARNFSLFITGIKRNANEAKASLLSCVNSIRGVAVFSADS